jgi:small subunit ribosomal protein S23
MHNTPNMTKTRAYDQARHEFYEARLQEDVERQVAKEEAMATGAYFGKSMLEVGMELEDKEYERWKKWALEQMEVTRLRRAAAYSGVPTVDDPETLAPDDLDPSLPVDEEEKADAVP